MIQCPNCQNKELPGAYFCSECGTPLIPMDFLNTRVINKSTGENLRTSSNAPTVQNRRVNPRQKDPDISLHLVESGKVVHLLERKEFTLGRAVEGQPILPDVDLTPYDAFNHGVSRMHVTLRIMNGEAYAMDLASSNGTRLNGQKLVPHVEYSVQHGDLLVLGKMKIQVLLIR